MKVALICPSNLLYMPYVDGYINILDEINVEYDIINWDRFGIDINESKELVYRDKKIGHQRNFLDYVKYKNFITKKIRKNKYNKIIVFGLQLSFFLKSFLKKKFNDRYIIDIRDYNRIIKLFNINKLIKKSALVVLSSPGFKEWLPESNKFIINHNTKIEGFNELQRLEYLDLKKKSRINISYIGTLRDYDINVELIKELKNNEMFTITYNGDGLINNSLLEFIKNNNVNNVSINGRYSRKDEESLYIESDIINILIPNKGINNKTLLTNRLYNAVLYGKPVLALKGTFQSEIVEKYNLGLVINDFNNLDYKILNYIKTLDSDINKSREVYYLDVLNENNYFKSSIKKFIEI